MASILRSTNYTEILDTPLAASITEGMIKLIGDVPAVAFRDEVAGTLQSYITEADEIEVAKKAASSGEDIALGGKIGFEAASGKARDYESGDVVIGWATVAALSAATTVRMRFKPQL